MSGLWGRGPEVELEAVGGEGFEVGIAGNPGGGMLNSDGSMLGVGDGFSFRFGCLQEVSHDFPVPVACSYPADIR